MMFTIIVIIWKDDTHNHRYLLSLVFFVYPLEFFFYIYINANNEQILIIAPFLHKKHALYFYCSTACIFHLTMYQVHEEASYSFLENLMICNSYPIPLTYCKCMIYWFLVYSHSCATIITVNFRTFLLTPERNPRPISRHFLFLPISPSTN